MGDYVADTAALDAKFGAERIIQLADWDGDGTADPTVVNRAIADAEAIVNAELNKRFDIDSVKEKTPPVVVGIALDLTLIELAKARDESLLEQGSGFYSIWREAKSRLRDIVRGVIDLDIDTVTEGAFVQIDANDRVFTRATLKGF